MNWFRECMEGGHQGVNKINERMRKAVGWPKMFSDSKEFVKVCPCRQVLKLSNQLFWSVRGILECPRPFELVLIDFIGLKTWNQRVWYVAVIVDYATRYKFNFFTHTCTSSDAKRAMIAYLGRHRQYYMMWELSLLVVNLGILFCVDLELNSLNVVKRSHKEIKLMRAVIRL